MSNCGCSDDKSYRQLDKTETITGKYIKNVRYFNNINIFNVNSQTRSLDGIKRIKYPRRKSFIFLY
jgi:hypothetical protein